nr:MAG TPA: hypothetical protein [Caudoviricetes sp.]DAX45027.1 MAG TPA: hypothetical protein [Caudoviricetes sp.]
MRNIHARTAASSDPSIRQLLRLEMWSTSTRPV